jgi:hypothetical protein
MISREPAGRVATRHGGEGIAAGDGPRSIARSERAAKISAGALRAERSRAVRERYMTALHMLAAVRPALLELPPERIEKALRIIEPRLLPGSPAHTAVLFATTCRAPRSFSRWLRRHPELVAAIRQEVAP